jgi:hypothetical protein
MRSAAQAARPTLQHFGGKEDKKEAPGVSGPKICDVSDQASDDLSGRDEASMC